MCCWCRSWFLGLSILSAAVGVGEARDLAALGDAVVLVVDRHADVPGATGVSGDAVLAALRVAAVAMAVAAGILEGELRVCQARSEEE
jgi:hypothetical protein